MTKIMSNSKERLNDKAQRFFEDSCTVQEPTVAYHHDYATEAHNESEEYIICSAIFLNVCPAIPPPETGISGLL